MRRALDAARAKLETASSRDEILECFFDHAKELFGAALLLVVRGEVAHGSRVRGLPAKEALVSRVAIPLDQPGILRRARELRRPFVGIPNLTDVDTQLFGTLGRTMPAAMVSPLVVRDRAVAFFIGDTPASTLQLRAVEAGRLPMDLAKEEMLLWSEAVSEALERFIRRKKGTGGSIPPPSYASYPPPGAPGGATPPLPRKASSVPPPARVPTLTELGSMVEDAERVDVAARTAPVPVPVPVAPPESSWLRWVLTVGGALIVAVGGVVLWRSRTSSTEHEHVAVAGSRIPGFPATVDPLKAIDLAREASGLGESGRLASIRAAVGPDGNVDVAAAAPIDEEGALVYTFVTDDQESEVRVDRDGMIAARPHPRPVCGGKPCHVVAPPPKCTFASVIGATKQSGAAANERGVVTYGVGSEGGDTASWSIEMKDRGRGRIDEPSCNWAPRQRLRPPPTPASTIPGAPQNVDPVSALTIARKQSGLDEDAMLAEIDVRGVIAPGRLDLTRPDGIATYTFRDPPTVAAGARRWRQVEIRSELVRVIADEGTRGPLPSRFEVALAPPKCRFADAFAYLMLGATQATAARVTYAPDPAMQQGRWTLELGSTEARKTTSDIECEAWANIHGPH